MYGTNVKGPDIPPPRRTIAQDQTAANNNLAGNKPNKYNYSITQLATRIIIT